MPLQPRATSIQFPAALVRACVQDLEAGNTDIVELTFQEIQAIFNGQWSVAAAAAAAAAAVAAAYCCWRTTLTYVL